jgi:protein phosphatase
VTLSLRYGARSDVGLLRDGNEDAMYAGPRLLAVADGMGGMAAGDVASNVVIAAMAPLDEDVPGDTLLDALRNAVDTANQQLRDAVEANPALEGMGTTLTAMLFSGSKFGMVHVGDSRAYLLRDSDFVQVTKDDTYVQMLVDEGRISAEEASSHPQRSLLTRALDGRDIDPEYSVRQALPGDRYLICSDGLSGVVSAETIGQTLREYPDPAFCVDRLVQLALRGGGPDNVTVIVADVINARVGDVVDDVPVVAGAFVDPAAAEVPGSDSPAERAAQMTRVPVASTPIPHREHHARWRGWLWALGAVVLVVGALAGTYAWTQSQYFVGQDGTEVAIYRGVDTEFGPLKFFGVYRNYSNLPMTNLTAFEQGKVRDGITANSLQDAERIIQDIRDHGLIPVCPPPSPSPTRSATTPSASKPSARRSVSAHRSASPTRRPSPTRSAAAPRTTSSVPAVVPTSPTSSSPERCRSGP